MAKEIKMPQLSDTMDSGKILEWKKSKGDTVARGDILAEVETDKANLEIECFDKGTILEIMTQAGDSAAVGETICVIGEAGEAVPASNGAADTNGAVSTSTTDDSTAHSSDNPAITIDAPTTNAEEPQTSSEELHSENARPVEGASQGTDSGRIKASPLAKRIAKERNIDLSQIQGSGPDGRIVKRDVDSNDITTPRMSSSNVPEAHAVSESTSARTPESTKSPAPTPSGEGSLTPLSKMRETIAKRMQQSVNESPHFYTTVTVNMSAAIAFRQACKRDPELEGISINHLIIKAAAYGLSKEPAVNSAMRDGQVYTPGEINIGIITALDGGLIIPVVRQVDRLSMRDLAFEARAAIERARAGRPSSSDLMGGTFSISNMGMYDVENFTAIINPGQGAVLAVSSTTDTVVAHEGQVAIQPMMKVTLSVDHRVIDGVMSANFLRHFRESLETPALLMV